MEVGKLATLPMGRARHEEAGIVHVLFETHAHTPDT